MTRLPALLLAAALGGCAGLPTGTPLHDAAAAAPPGASHAPQATVLEDEDPMFMPLMDALSASLQRLNAHSGQQP